MICATAVLGEAVSNQVVTHVDARVDAVSGTDGTEELTLHAALGGCAVMSSPHGVAAASW
jgi:kynurenine formamidase